MGAALPSIEDFPIPRDIAPGPGWSAQMVEMAAHIGAFDTLAISLNFGGQEIYVPADADRNPFRDVVGPAKARTLSRVYRRETLAVPTARSAIARARRAPVIAAVRAGTITVSDAARILKLRRDYTSRLVNGSDEGRDTAPSPLFQRKVDPRQLDMFSSHG